MRGTYGSLSRRVAEAERRAATIPGGGCPTCAGWKDYPVTGHDQALAHGWPETFVCPDCGREPLAVFHITYVDWRRPGSPLADLGTLDGGARD